ncbi:transcription factor IIIB 60 kDa subunit-like isoform X2 [Curcuma longa]|uniref:transcription factor IIIB 60 kDa subunit-like isoform X2 n=1 Tax=Curcuma longa TaxID=136217 RepID=UPI003D9EEC6F
MGWCSHCNDDCSIYRDPDNGYVCCALCGKILDQDIYYTGPTFAKDSSGQSRLTGNLMKILQHELSGSYERTLQRGRDEISYIVTGVNLSGGDTLINNAHAFYQMAVDKNFTRGRRIPYVAAACLYLACRQQKMDYLLIDFSDYLQINVYVLGAVFLQLCKTLQLLEHPIVQNIVDPSLFIHRFSERGKNNAVSDTALRLVASMKRDWMQTGRKPSGLCGAALYISVHSHGFNYSKSDIGSVVHICEATLTRRLLEFESTESGSLTIEEFLSRAEDLDVESPSNQLPKPGKVICKHKETDTSHFAHGLCKECYDEFVEISGGLQGGADPPAFQRAEKQRMEKVKLPEESNLDNQQTNEKHINITNEGSCDVSSTPSVGPVEGKTSKESKEPGNGDSAGHESIDPSTFSEQHGYSDFEDDGSDHFSDIDDAEVNGYLHTEKEKELKKIIWEEMNKEYLEEQAEKEAAAAAAREAYEAQFANGSEELLVAKELAEATNAALAKFKKEKKQRRAEELKNMTPARTPLEAVHRMLKKKTFSSKVNYEALENMFLEQDSAKRQKVESDAGDPHETLDKKDDHSDNLDNKDGDEPGASENDNYDGTYDDYKGDCDEGYNYGDEDYGYKEDEFEFE